MATHTLTLPVQQPQEPTYNHPSDELFDGRKRKDYYLGIVVPLYNASIEGDLEAAKRTLQKHENVVRCSITERKDTPLHVAAAGPSTELVSCLVKLMSTVDLELQNADGNTALCVAAISGNVAMVQIMVEKNQALLTICGNENMKPLHLAAYHGKRDVVTFLYNSGQMTGDEWTDDDRDGVLLKCIQSDILDIAEKILNEHKVLPQDNHLSDVLHVLARKPEAFEFRISFLNLQLWTFFYLVKTRLFPKKKIAPRLLRKLWERIMEKPKDVIDKILKSPMTVEEECPNHKMETSQILFIAAKMNNHKFLAELIRGYPDLIWKKNDDGQTMFHVAVSHRHRETFFLLHEIGSMKDLVASITDKQGNNLLHLAAKKPEDNDYEDRLTVTCQVHNEILWYKKVEDIVPPPCRQVKNAGGQTPQQVFIETHKEQYSDSRKWIKDTVNVSMVVAALVCTISFSVVSSIPGGFNENTGYPIFLHKKMFTAFLTMDALSFIMSATSIIHFLSAILSLHHGNMGSLLTTWMTAQALLLSSVYYLSMAYCFSFVLLYGNTLLTNVLSLVAFIVVVLCGHLSLSCLYVASGGMLRPKISMLYPKSLHD